MLRLASLVLLACLFASSATAQRGGLNPRFGAGFDALLSLASGDVLDDGFGLGVRGRASFPINADFSVAVGAGFAGFLLGGRDDANYLFNPQVSGIVTLPRSPQWARYLIGGFGGYFPLGDSNAEGGPALHLGLGWVRPLNESSLYVEIDPALVIGESRTALIVPARVGVIF
ncbi:MAG: hypothetical protein ABJF88_13955 [Rhodothermales bacterium]